MTRNSTLFAGSVVAAVAGATGLVLATSSPSFAAAGDTAYGVSYADPIGSAGWTTGSVTSGYGLFTASASTSGGTSVVTSTIAFGSRVTVTTSCVAGKPRVVVAGGGAAGTYNASKTVSLASFAGNSNLVGSVTLLSAASGVTTGAYVNFSPGVEGSWARLGGVKCAAAPPTSTSTAPTSTSTAPTSTSTSTAPTSTSTAPTSTSTSTATSTSTSTSTAPTSTATSTSTGPTATGTSTSTSTPTGTGTPSPTSSTTGPPIVTDGPQAPAGSSTPWLPIGGLGLAMLGAGALVVNTIRTRQE